MHTSDEMARNISSRAFKNARPRASFYKMALCVVSYAVACGIVALAMAYFPASAGNNLTGINVIPMHLTSALNVSNRMHKADRLSRLSFEERWSAVPTSSAVVGADSNRREAPRAEEQEKIPFSCDLAFSRLVTKGNFSTRCIAALETSQIDT